MQKPAEEQGEVDQIRMQIGRAKVIFLKKELERKIKRAIFLMLKKL